MSRSSSSADVYVFSHATTDKLRRLLTFDHPDLAFRQRLVTVPPWELAPGEDVHVRCAFLEVREQTVPLVSGWVTSLLLLNPGIRIYLLAPARLKSSLHGEFSSRVKDILSLRTPKADLERRALRALKSPPPQRHDKGSGPVLTATESIEIASFILGRIYESLFLVQDGIIVGTSMSFFRELGYHYTDLQGRHFLTFIPPDEREKVLRNYTRRMRGEPAEDVYETAVYDSERRPVPVEFIVHRTTFRGRPAAAGSIREIAERIAWRREREKRERELALLGDVTHKLNSGRRLVPALRSAIDRVIESFSADTGSVFLAEERHFSPAVMRRRTDGGPRTLHECDDVTLPRSFTKALRQGRAVHESPCPRGEDSHHLCAPLLSKKRLVGFIHLVRETPFDADEEALLVYVGTEAAMGVELRRLYEDLDRSYQDLVETQKQLLRRERLAVIGRMAAQLAHEIRNPVATIMNATGQIRRRTQLAGVEAELADIIEEELERLKRLCDDLVMFARSPSPRPRSLQIEPFLEYVRSELQEAQVLPPTVETTLDISPRELEVSHDPDILFPLLRNLVQNSIQSMGSHGELRITARLADRIVLEVADSGPGIPSDILDKIFDPFFSTRPEAAGLGLAIVRHYVEELGGELEVEIREGTAIRLLLPPITPSQEDGERL